MNITFEQLKERIDKRTKGMVGEHIENIRKRP